MIVAYLLSLLAGINVAVQIALNNRLSNFLPRAYVILVSHLGGALLIGVIIFAAWLLGQRGFDATQAMREAPWYTYVGGACGVIIVACVLASLRSLSLASVLSMVIAGELFTSLLLDRFAWGHGEQVPLSKLKIVGGLLVCAGTYLLKK